VGALCAPAIAGSRGSFQSLDGLPRFFWFEGQRMRWIMDDTQNRGLIGNVVDWWRHPFSSQGSVLTWILFVGLLIIAAGLWQFVIIDITREV
jgi:hypothetical protein